MLLSEQDWNKAWAVYFKPLSGGRLHLSYPDGEERIFDVWDYLKRHGLVRGFWKKLFDQDYFNSVKPLGGMPDWEDGLINIAPEIILTESDPIGTFRSSFMSLSMTRITADGAIPGIHLYINEKDHPPFHIFAKTQSNMRANFNLDGSIRNGHLEADDIKLVSDFIKKNRRDILNANKRILKGIKPKFLT